VETRVANPVLLSGDVHAHYAAELKADFKDVRSRTIGVEFTNTSISSNGDGSAVTPEFEAIKADNPHIKHHSNLRGYLGCSVTPETFRADFKVLDRVTIPDAPVRSSGTLIVEAGRPGCRPA
jgi:alkaline phosphatase D